MEKAKRMVNLLDVQGLKDAINQIDVMSPIFDLLLNELESRLTTSEFVTYSKEM